MTTRIPVDTHRRAVIEARRRGWTLNDFLVACLDGGTVGQRPPQIVQQKIKIRDDDGNVVGWV